MQYRITHSRVAQKPTGDNLRVVWAKFSTFSQAVFVMSVMEQRALKNVQNWLNTNIYSYLKTSSGQSSNLYLNVVHFFNTSVN
jgi:hypothetical protein